MKNKLMIAALGFIISGYVMTANIVLAEEANHWIKKSQKIKGSWNVETRDDGDYLVLDEDFKTRKGPDLKLILTKLPSSEVTGDNATSDSITIAPLSSPKGEQSYKLPEQYQDYSTLLIHCEKYSKLWGASDFNHSDDSAGE